MHSYDRWDRGWRRFEQMARQWGRQGFQNFDNWGGSFRIGRMLASGDVRLVALYLIEQQPRHGYDLIKAIEEKSQGFYSPSPGIVYPALTFLDEAGFVTSAPDGNKKLYTITDEGRSHLSDNREAIQKTFEFLEKAGERMKQFRDMAREGWHFDEGHQHGAAGEHRGPQWGHRGPPPPPPHDRDMRDVLPEVNEARKRLKRAIKEAVAGGDAEQRRVAEILRRAADEIRRGAGDDEVDL